MEKHEHILGLLRAEGAGKLAPLIRSGVLTLSPRAGGLGGGLFSASYDWHSCVHAHWALLCMARLCRDAELEQFLADRLTPQALEAERRALAAAAAFELPYGRAWLLLLLAELERRGREDAAALRQEAEAAVLGWLEATPCRASGGHGCWLLAWFLARLSCPGRTACLQRLYERCAAPMRAELLAAPCAPSDFVHLPSLLAAIECALAPAASAPTAPASTPPSACLAITSFGDCHAAGAEAMRLWAPAESGASFERALAGLLERTDLWAGDFSLTAHWVPQFVFMGLWLNAGQP